MTLEAKSIRDTLFACHYRHKGMTPCAIFIFRGFIVTSHTAVDTARIMHCLCKCDVTPIFCLHKRMTLVTGAYFSMVTFFTGIGQFLMSLVVEWDKIHTCFLLKLLRLVQCLVACFNHDHIRLFPLNPGNRINLLYLLLFSKIMTTAALNRSIFLFFLFLSLHMTIHTVGMRCNLHGTCVILLNFLVAITARCLFILWMNQFFGFLVVFMMAPVTYIFIRRNFCLFQGVCMAVMQRLIHSNRLPFGCY